jgi:hypothetical protein
MTRRRVVRSALIGADGLVAVTAIGGGLALAGGLEGSRFPIDWLTGTPFASYLEPGLILAVFVGGSAAMATIVTVRSPSTGGWASVVAGLVLFGWILGEIGILTGDGQLVSATELFYLVVALGTCGLGWELSRDTRRVALPTDSVPVADRASSSGGRS